MYSRTTLFVAITNWYITCCRLSSSHKIGSAEIAVSASRMKTATGRRAGLSGESQTSMFPHCHIRELASAWMSSRTLTSDRIGDWSTTGLIARNRPMHPTEGGVIGQVPLRTGQVPLRTGQVPLSNWSSSFPLKKGTGQVDKFGCSRVRARHWQVPEIQLGHLTT